MCFLYGEGNLSSVGPTNLQRKPGNHQHSALQRWVFLQGSSSPVCPVVLRTHGGECRPSAMSDSEHWASPWITARPKRRRSAYDWALTKNTGKSECMGEMRKTPLSFSFLEMTRNGEMYFFFIHQLPLSCWRGLCHNDGISVIRNLKGQRRTDLKVSVRLIDCFGF